MLTSDIIVLTQGKQQLQPFPSPKSHDTMKKIQKALLWNSLILLSYCVNHELSSDTAQ